MLDNTSRYIYEIYRERSVSKASKKLFVSQAALSSSLKKAEEELGFCIFNRKTLPFTLTSEGRAYIDGIEKMLEIEKETRHRIEDITDFRNGKLRIASANHLSTFVIPKVCHIFRLKYPGVDVSIQLRKTDELTEMLQKDECDLIFTSAEPNEDSFIVQPLFKESFAVTMRRDAVPACLKEYVLTYGETVGRSYPLDKVITDLRLFRDVEFVYSPPYSKTYKVKTQLFGVSTVSHVTSDALNLQLNFNLAEAGFGAFFSTDAVIATFPPSESLAYFIIETPDLKQSFNAIYIRDESSHAYKPIKEFVGIAGTVFNDSSPFCDIFKY